MTLQLVDRQLPFFCDKATEKTITIHTPAWRDPCGVFEIMNIKKRPEAIVESGRFGTPDQNRTDN